MWGVSKGPCSCGTVGNPFLGRSTVGGMAQVLFPLVDHNQWWSQPPKATKPYLLWPYTEKYIWVLLSETVLFEIWHSVKLPS